MGQPDILVLALGNDILSDDGVAFAAADELRPQLEHSADVSTTGEAGLALLEQIAGYRSVLLMDSLLTGIRPPGSIVEFGPDDFRRVVAPSPHYAGLPEVLELGRRLALPMPGELRVLAMEVADPFTIHEGLSPAVAAALPEFVRRADAIVRSWTDGQSPGSISLARAPAAG